VAQQLFSAKTTGRYARFPNPDENFMRIEEVKTCGVETTPKFT
jgi:hypothetical protein